MVRSLPWLSGSIAAKSKTRPTTLKSAVPRKSDGEAVDASSSRPTKRPRHSPAAISAEVAHPVSHSSSNLRAQTPTDQNKKSVSASKTLEQWGSSSPVDEGEGEDGSDDEATAPSRETMRSDGFDDQYMMVEDELLCAAQLFTKTVHKAEYQRLKRTVLAKSDASLATEHASSAVGVALPAHATKAKRTNGKGRHAVREIGEDESSSSEVEIRDANLARLMNRSPYISSSSSSLSPLGVSPLTSSAAGGGGGGGGGARQQQGQGQKQQQQQQQQHEGATTAEKIHAETETESSYLTRSQENPTTITTTTTSSGPPATRRRGRTRAAAGLGPAPAPAPAFESSSTGAAGAAAPSGEYKYKYEYEYSYDDKNNITGAYVYDIPSSKTVAAPSSSSSCCTVATTTKAAKATNGRKPAPAAADDGSHHHQHHDPKLSSSLETTRQQQQLNNDSSRSRPTLKRNFRPSAAANHQKKENEEMIKVDEVPTFLF